MTEVVVVSIGTAKAEETLRTALAMGADRAVLVETEDRVEPLVVAKILTGVAEAEQPGGIIVAKQVIDDDANQTGQMLAALLGWAQGCLQDRNRCRQGDHDPGSRRRSPDHRDQASGGRHDRLCLNEPDYASLPNIMKAKNRARPLSACPPRRA